MTEQYSVRTQFTLLQSTGRREFKARFVRAGQVRGGGNKLTDVLIEPDALKAAVEKGMFEGKAVFLDHTGMFDYPSVKNLAGVTLNALWNDEEQSVDGTISFYSEVSKITDLIDEILSDSTPPDIGLSIVFWPKWAEGKNSKRRIVEITHVESVDLVFEPAADGRILQALSTYYQSHVYQPRGESFTMTTPLEPSPEVPVSTAVPPIPEPDPLQAWLPAMANLAASQMIASSGLPGASQDRLRSRQYASPEEVTAAIEDERRYLAALAASNIIQIGGQAPRGANIQVGMDGVERLQYALEALINGSLPPKGVAPLTGIREAYMLLSGDYEMTGLFHSDRIQFANVTSATMANIVANALNKRAPHRFRRCQLHRAHLG